MVIWALRGLEQRNKGKTVREILLGKSRKEERKQSQVELGNLNQVRSEEAAMKPVKQMKWMRRG